MLVLVAGGLLTSGVAVTSILRHSLINRVDQSLAEAYLALPLIHRASIYGEFLEREMVERFCEHNAFIPELVLADD